MHYKSNLNTKSIRYGCMTVILRIIVSIGPTLICLKFLKLVSFSWLWVLSPYWISALIGIIYAILSLLISKAKMINDEESYLNKKE